MIVEIRDEVVALSGVLRRNQWRTLESAVKVRLKHHPAGIVVDCGGLESITAEGAETFRDAAAHIAASNARIVVARVPPEVMKVLRKVPSLGSQLPLAATVAEARASLGLENPTRQRRAGESPSNIVVGLLGNEADVHAVMVACRLGRAMQSTVHLAYLLVVPRNKPLLSPMGDEEEEARRALSGLEGAVRKKGLQAVPRIERTRDPAARLIEVASEVHSETIVLSLPGDCPEEQTTVAETLLARGPCDVVIDRLPRPAAAPAQGAAALPLREGALS